MLKTRKLWSPSHPLVKFMIINYICWPCGSVVLEWFVKTMKHICTSVATVMTDIFQKIWIMISRKLAKIMRIFVEIGHIKNCRGSYFGPKESVQYFPCSIALHPYRWLYKYQHDTDPPRMVFQLQRAWQIPTKMHQDYHCELYVFCQEWTAEFTVHMHEHYQGPFFLPCIYHNHLYSSIQASNHLMFF